jgi:dihydrofolate reductase
MGGSASPLYPDLEALRGTAYMNALIEETGAVLMGKRTFEMGDPDSYAGNYEFQVPIFVLTHEPPRVAPDELRLDVMPVLLGAGLRFFDDTDLGEVQLEKTGVQEIGARTSLTFRVKK